MTPSAGLRSAEARPAAPPPRRPRTRPSCRAVVAELGLPGFRADQLARHYFGRFTADLDAMTDLPAPSARRCGRCCRRSSPRSSSRPATTAPPARPCGGATTARAPRSVLMRYPDRATVCVSSQAGCGMACPFCATGQGGLERNLSTARDRRAGPPGRRRGPRRRCWASRRGCPTSCSWAWASRSRTTSGWCRRSGGSPSRRRTGLGISQRSVTVSTVGLAPAIRKLADEQHAGAAGGVAAHPGRRAARHAGAGEQPVVDRRGARRGPVLRRHLRSAGVHRVRVDPGHQRPALAGRAAGEAAALSTSASWCT